METFSIIFPLILVVLVVAGLLFWRFGRSRLHFSEAVAALTVDPVSGSRSQFFLTVGLLVSLFVFFMLYVVAEKEIDVAHSRRLETFQLADELRQSSDDLTLMVRAYVMTGDPDYERHYHEILDIRNGKKPRPEQYERIYWDLVSVNSKKPHPDGVRSMALLDLMREAGVTDSEFVRVEEAKASSDALTTTEFEAMRLVKSTGPEAQESLAKARTMLFDRNYFQAKAAIMKPIDDFYTLLDRRTEDEIRSAERKAMVLRLIVLALGIMLAMMLWRIYRQLGEILGGNVGEVYRHLERLGKGDFSKPIDVPNAARSTSIMGWLAEAQSNLAALEKINRVLLERSQQIVNTALDAVVSMNANGKITGWNSQAEFIFGWKSEEALGRTLSETIIPPAYREAHEHGFRKYLVSGISSMLGRRIEVVAMRRDGSEFPVELAVNTLMVDGELQFSAFIRDISERRVAESRLNAVFNATVVGIVMIDEFGAVLEFSPASQSIFGYSREEVIGRNVSLLMPEPYRSAHDGYIRRYVESWNAKILGTGREVPGLRKDGTVFPMELFVDETDAAGKRNFIGFIRDITERKQHEAAIRHFEAIVQSSDDAIISKTLEGIITSWNMGAEKMFGYPASEMLGKSMSALFPPDRLNEEAVILEKISQGGTVEHFETARMCRDGRMINISATISPIRDENGKVIGASKIARDVSERVRYVETLQTNESQIREAYRQLKENQLQMLQLEKLSALGTLVGGVAHEINNPLMGAMNYLDAAGRRIQNEQAIDLIDRAQREIQRIAAIVKNMLVFLHSGSEKSEGSCNVAEVLQESLETIHSRLKSNEVNVERKFQEDIPPVACSADGLRQILLNLLVNACDAMQDAPRRVIEVSCSRHADKVEITVTDSGSGIPPDILSKIYDPFFTTKPPGKGTGLGLAVTRQLVNAAGGEIGVTNREIGGTCFTLHLDVAQSKAS